MTKKLFGERLVEAGLINGRQLAQALQAQQSTGEQLGRLLARLGYVTEEQLVQLLCEDAGIPFTDLADAEIRPSAIAALPENIARAYTAFPLNDENGQLRVALADPFDVAALASIERATGRRVTPVGAPRDRIIEAADVAYKKGDRGLPTGELINTSDNAFSGRYAGGAAQVTAPPTPADDSGQNATEAADQIFRDGIRLGATDIHIEPTPDSIIVRYRIDGILREGPKFPKQLQSPVITRIKVLAGLNIAENRLPQDGRLRLDLGNREVDLRVSTFPTVHGEDLVLRILDRSRVELDLAKIGMEGPDLDLYREVLTRPSGLVLITGPTGSGKTTTLYAGLTELNTGQRCILTLEDPVEYEIRGIRQSQIHPRAGLTFASGLRSMLRHDPDVILVGEIRDLDTAEIALSAAMTGHLVLSTLHTNSAAAAIPRMLDMGVEPYALASSMQLAVAQRLLRVVCPSCREPADIPSAVRRRFNLEDITVYQARGCSECHGTGYRGRVAIFEMLPASQALATAIYSRQSTEEIERVGTRRKLLQAGLARVREGTTTLEELLRVVSL